MGRGYVLECAKCGMGIGTYYVGTGMMYVPSSIRSMLKSLIRSREIRSHVETMLDKGASFSDGGSYGHDLYICPKCNKLYERFYFRLECGSEIYEPPYMCHKCKKPLLLARFRGREQVAETGDYFSATSPFRIVGRDDENIAARCPNCGGDEFNSIVENFMWD